MLRGDEILNGLLPRAREREVASVALRISTEFFLRIIYIYAFTAAPWAILVWGVAVAGGLSIVLPDKS